VIYLGGPIDFVSEYDDESIRGLVVGALVDLELGIFSPARAYPHVRLNPDQREAADLCQVNDHALDICTAAVFVWWEPTMSVGTPVEIHIAIAREKPVLILHNGWMNTSYWARGNDWPIFSPQPEGIAALVHDWFQGWADPVAPELGDWDNSNYEKAEDYPR
jgi:hypothetical protein